MSRLFDDASTQYLSEAAAPVSATPLTLAGWFRSDDATVEQMIVAVGVNGSPNNRWSLSIAGQAAGDPVRATARTTSSQSSDTGTGYSVNTWHHAAGVFVSATSRFAYIDGTVATESTGSRTPSGMDQCRIGAIGDATLLMSGRIAEVGIWNVALTAGEVAALARGVSPLRIRPGNLVRYYPIRGVQSPEISPRTSNTITLVNAPVVADHAPVQPLLWRTGSPMPAAVPPPAGGDVFIEGLHRIHEGMKPLTAAGLGGVLVT